ncbi:PadR family transcriptional regulator [Chryseobacterium sp. PTM-20240506]|uniref:PadR family transcriptional regulator n=1 Tax=unclassified Chryseobacterium TaxID=2593645 RepID=UPI00155476A0|nr:MULTISPECIES: PadR family transcriptional regulator [unclassified Chryseobacterium]MDC8105665.1 PadR family transcriptional regulator [Chryseobacterium sp. B21-037]MDQ1806312.1 PadR family transcriptional regulator [Chryseobacterium sp. CKR4-1]
MSTKHIIMSMLEIAPMTGYEIAQNLSTSVVPFWSATASQIYNALKSMKESNLVETENSIRGEKMNVEQYTLTDTGRKELDDWIQDDIQYIPIREPFLLWSSYMEKCTLEQALSVIDKHIEKFEKRARQLEEATYKIQTNEYKLMKMRSESTPKEKFKKIQMARAFAYGEIAAKARFEVEQAKRIRQFAYSFFSENDL